MEQERETLLDSEPGIQGIQKKPNQKKTLVITAVVLVVLAVLAGLIYGIVVSIQNKAPTLIILSLDGFRYDYLKRGHTPNIKAVADEGVQAQYMVPIFPSKTFPNHYTLVTGLYAESHGIVSNTFYDPELDLYFRISDPEAVTNADFWGGEPIWNTVEFQGQTAACCFWPGSEAPIQGIRPSYYLPFDDSISNPDRVAQVLEWLQLPPSKRPNFITLYFSDVDTVGHQHGPDSEEIVEAFREVDDAVGLLIQGLKDLGIYDKVNFIITADHGMTTVTQQRVILLDDFIDLTKVEVVDWSPIAAIIPKEGYADQIYANLSMAGPTHNFTVYQRDGPSFIPERYHYTDNIRITPLIVDSDLGYQITSRPSFEANPSYYDGGTHGYDNMEMDMAALFVARGPKFKKQTILDPFHNVEVYNLMARILGLKPAPNNGTANSQLIRQALIDS